MTLKPGLLRNEELLTGVLGFFSGVGFFFSNKFVNRCSKTE